MTNDELNQYILHYVAEDKTNSAIMLTGDWGTGKSYYIQHSLKPFLEKDENGNHQCVVVSLYGLKDTAEISKGIYFGTRLKFLETSSEKATTVRIAGKTILKGVAGFFGVDLSKDEESLQKLYESVDLTGKLIVLEDLERSGIDILEVLGYVNNLVEQDGVKVLLVANENELIRYEQINEATREKQETAELMDSITNHKDRKYTELTKEYLKTKEKTVNDTIFYDEDYQTAIPEIIRLFENDTLNKFSSSERVEEIFFIMTLCKSNNLRSFIFACQKTSDILNSLETKYLSDDAFIKAVFFGVLFFVLKQKAGKSDKWGQEKYFSTDLGHEKAPLFKFCYDYITMQIKQFDEIASAYQAYSELVLFDENRSNVDNDISILQTYYIQTEKDIKSALNNIAKRLETPEDISFYRYGDIAVYSIILKGLLNCEIDKIKKLLVDNLKDKGDKLELEQIFRTILGDDCSPEQKAEYESLRKEMAESLKAGNMIIPDFDYLPAQSKDFYDYILNNGEKFHIQGSFAARLDSKKLSVMFRNCTAEQKQYIRRVFLDMYRAANIKMYLSGDKESIERLYEFIKNDRSNDVGDTIQQLQYDWFIHNLETIIMKLS